MSVVLNLLGVKVAEAAALTTSTLATSIDSVSSNFYDYFLVFLSNAWPFILGASILVGLVVLAIKFARRIFHG